MMWLESGNRMAGGRVFAGTSFFAVTQSMVGMEGPMHTTVLVELVWSAPCNVSQPSAAADKHGWSNGHASVRG